MPVAEQDDHGRQVARLFGKIAPWYDFLNHFLSLGRDIAWRKRLVRCARMQHTSRVLDLAGLPGNTRGAACSLWIFPCRCSCTVKKKSNLNARS